MPAPRPDVHLRPLRSGEHDALQAVFDAAPDHFQAMAGMPAAPPDAAEEEVAGCDAAEHRGVALIVEEVGDGSARDVGAVGWWARRPEEDTALLGMLVVVPDHRGRGVARAALAALEAQLAADGVARLRTAVPRRAREAQRAVRALGFAEMSLADHQVLGKAGATISLWEKPVAPPTDDDPAPVADA